MFLEEKKNTLFFLLFFFSIPISFSSVVSMNPVGVPLVKAIPTPVAPAPTPATLCPDMYGRGCGRKRRQGRNVRNVKRLCSSGVHSDGGLDVTWGVGVRRWKEKKKEEDITRAEKKKQKKKSREKKK